MDDRGNAIEAEIVYLDRTLDGTRWIKWTVGHTLHLHPFKFRLEKTSRAGLHVVMEMRGQDGQFRYLNNMKVTEGGIFVLNPTCTIWPSRRYSLVARGSREELHISKMLDAVFGLGRSLRALCGAKNLPISMHKHLRHFFPAA